MLPRNGHAGPNPGIVAIIYTLLFNAGLCFVISFRAPEHLAASATAVRPYFPGPWESAQTIVTYFQSHPGAVLLCAFLQFGAAIPLGLFTATMVSRLQFLGVRAAGVHIARSWSAARLVLHRLLGGAASVFRCQWACSWRASPFRR
jgi:hypothetical protein